MRLKVLIVLGIVAVILGNTTVQASDSKPSAKNVGDGIICQCGCNQTVSACNHYMCSSRTEMQAMAEKEIAAGKDETAILQDFVLRYGVKVLATPPAQGFNLTIWILPAVGFILGLMFVVALVRRWRRPQPAPVQPAPVDPKLLAEIEEEIKSSGLGSRV